MPSFSTSLFSPLSSSSSSVLDLTYGNEKEKSDEPDLFSYLSSDSSSVFPFSPSGSAVSDESWLSLSREQATSLFHDLAMTPSTHTTSPTAQPTVGVQPAHASHDYFPALIDSLSDVSPDLSWRLYQVLSSQIVSQPVLPTSSSASSSSVGSSSRAWRSAASFDPVHASAPIVSPSPVLSPSASTHPSVSPASSAARSVLIPSSLPPSWSLSPKAPLGQSTSAPDSSATWPFFGRPLSFIKRLFPDKFVDTSSLSCKFCKKLGHDVHSCPASVQAGVDEKQPPFLKFILAESSAPIAATWRGQDWSFIRSVVSALASAFNQDNPFLELPDRSEFALRKKLGMWKAIGAPKVVLHWIAHGFPLRFIAEPPKVAFRNHPGADRYASFLDEEIAKRVAKGQFEVVDLSFAHQIHPLDVVPKTSGGFRIILDCRLINGFLPDMQFRLENLSHVPQIVKPGDWLFSTDLEDAYFHIPLAKESKKHVCFMWKGVTYCSNVLPFGLGLAPWVFTKTVRPVVAFCRAVGTSVLAYLDDFLWAAESKNRAQQLADFARWLLRELGFAVSEKKSEWSPVQLIRFLGLLVNSAEYSFEIPVDRLEKIKAVIADVLRSAEKGSKVEARSVARLCGHLISVRLAVSPARIFTRALYADINDTPFLSNKIRLSEQAIDELQFWNTSLSVFNGKALIRDSSTQFLFSDASDDGWGAHVNNVSAFGIFPPSLQSAVTSSTRRELQGLLFALRSPQIAKVVANSRVTFVLDSLAAVFNLNKGGGPKPDLSAVVKDIWLECLRLNIDAVADWVPRSLNERADSLSHFIDRADWSLRSDVFNAVSKRWGPFSIDLFAATHNTKCKRFFSRFYDPAALATDAFAQDWSGENAFAHPDFNCIAQTIAHAQSCVDRSRRPLSLTLIAPNWVSAPWMKTAMGLSTDSISLPDSSVALIPGPRSQLPEHTKNWKLIALFLHVAPAPSKK